MFLRLFSASVVGFSFVALALPAFARPEMTSGDLWLEGITQQECLTRTDGFIQSLNVPVEEGERERTGFFDDGVFRILCYAGGNDSSMLLVVSVHNSSAEVATQFMNLALSSISQSTQTTSN
jgi:hypothetical protein